MSNITVFVADDHPMLLKGVVNELEAHHYTVVATAENGAQALEKIMALNPDIALLDVEMPMLNGFEVIQKCQGKKLNTKFIILTSHKEKGFVHKARMLNISGYMMKDEPFKALHACIQHVNRGTPYFSSVFKDVLSKEIEPQLQKIRLLSPSERTILRLVAQGKSSKDIGEQLSVSARTVEKHRSNIIAKLDLPPQADALFAWTKEFQDIVANL